MANGTIHLRTKAAGCAELASIAERELAAYFQAVTELYGDTYARLMAEEWIRHFDVGHIPIESARRACRLVTLSAAASVVERGIQCEVNKPEMPRKAL
jgi:hypothetical protein